MKTKLSLLLALSILLSACAGVAKAPCDLEAHFCGQKVKINQW